MLKSAFLLAVATIASAAPAPMPTPPGISDQATAQSQLDSLVVKPYYDPGGYSRDLFPHWSTYSGTCNTREYVLQRDGKNVVVDSTCAATSGSWTSPYDGATWTLASDIDIDHMVPLKNSWVSGASTWTTTQRQKFANDVSRPQLWAVTDNVNQAKGDQSPDTWKPSVAAFHCTYAKSWINVKYYYNLTITSNEKSALTSMINTCA